MSLHMSALYAQDQSDMGKKINGINDSHNSNSNITFLKSLSDTYIK